MKSIEFSNVYEHCLITKKFVIFFGGKINNFVSLIIEKIFSNPEDWGECL
jgi:hypothetical protein